MVGGKYGMERLKANTLQQLLARFRLEHYGLGNVFLKFSVFIHHCGKHDGSIEDGGIYQQDIAECHTTDSVRAWFKEHQDQFIVLPCPENSPDLSPISNLWNPLDRVVRVMDPHARNLVQQ
ncbi:transposable element Tcb1 transposase [Trichonephila clavipes]|uniref:Transposable element Tcb1 transposase n=1 Tax=Trichonephila clavipes TaxID=2585209 RepID=A0A8X6S7G0_TRICX|nr:transposable element Tcb1 transposase [Trichonephila clavipes]